MFRGMTQPLRPPRLSSFPASLLSSRGVRDEGSGVVYALKGRGTPSAEDLAPDSSAAPQNDTADQTAPPHLTSILASLVSSRGVRDEGSGVGNPHSRAAVVRQPKTPPQIFRPSVRGRTQNDTACRASPACLPALTGSPDGRSPLGGGVGVHPHTSFYSPFQEGRGTQGDGSASGKSR